MTEDEDAVALAAEAHVHAQAQRWGGGNTPGKRVSARVVCRPTPSSPPPPPPPPRPPGGAVLGGLAWRGLARHTHSSPRCTAARGVLTRRQPSPGDEPCICGDEPWPLCGSAVSTYSTQAAAAFAAADPWVLRRRVLRMERILPRLGEVDEVLRRHADLNRENAHTVGVRIVLRARRTCYACTRHQEYA